METPVPHVTPASAYLKHNTDVGKSKRQTDQIIVSDNLVALRDLDTDSVDLVYCDPPFDTRRDFAEGKGGYTDKPSADRPASILILQDDFSWMQDVATPTQRAYYETVIPVLIEIEQILKPSGALYYHCDWRTSAHMRLVLNQI